MKKIICIGECSLNVVLGADGKPLGSMVGGRVINAAVLLAAKGFEVLVASESGTDPVGDIVTDFIKSSGTDVRSLDRFTEGTTTLNVFTPDKDGAYVVTRYENYPEECFDIIWPRIDEGDIVLFGGFYSIDGRVHPRLMRLLEYAAERKAVLVYLPGFAALREPRITRVMPAILENLELADMVVTRNEDLRLIFGVEDSRGCYDDHINFYCRSLVNINEAEHRIDYYSGTEISSCDIVSASCSSMMWNAGVLAGIVASLAEQNLTADSLDAVSDTVRVKILAAAAGSAAFVAGSFSQHWQTMA